jgi:ABC-2 type transport system permease protein
MWRLLRSEIFRQRKRLLTKVLLALLVVIVVSLYILLWVASGRVASGGLLVMRRALFLQETVPFGLQLVWFFWGLLAAVLAAGIAGSDFAWGTMRLLVMCSRSRTALFGAKLLTILIFTVIGAAIGLATAVLTSTVITIQSGGADFSFVTGRYVLDAAISFGRTVLTILPFSAIAVCFAIIGRSTLAGVAAALGWRFLEGLVASLMNLAGGFWATIPDYLLRANVSTIQLGAPLSRSFTRTIGNEATLSRLPSQEHALLVILAYTVITLVAAGFVFARRDVTH